jgi:hypothetical protein
LDKHDSERNWINSDAAGHGLARVHSRQTSLGVGRISRPVSFSSEFMSLQEVATVVWIDNTIYISRVAGKLSPGFGGGDDPEIPFNFTELRWNKRLGTLRRTTDSFVRRRAVVPRGP